MGASYVGEGVVVVPVEDDGDGCAGGRDELEEVMEGVELWVLYTRECSCCNRELLSGFCKPIRRCGSTESE